jgi:cathepsin K
LTEGSFLPGTSSSVRITQSGREFPARIDLTEKYKGYFPPVGSQGQQYSCTAWAVAYTTLTFLVAKSRTAPAARNVTFSPAFVYNSKTPDRRQCTYGLSVGRALDFVKFYGAPPLSTMPPYDDSDCAGEIPDPVYAAARALSVGQYQPLYPANEISVLKSILNNDLPVVMVLSVDSHFQGLRSPVYNWKGPAVGLHTVTLVGYDDTYPVGANIGLGAMKILNSFGEEFGTQGFAWIPYADLQRVVQEAWVIAHAQYNPGRPVATQAKAGPAAEIDSLVFRYGKDPRWPAPAVTFVAKGKVKNAAGQNINLVMTFTHENGNKIVAGRQEREFVAPDDFVTATRVIPAEQSGSPENLEFHPLVIPISAFNFLPNRGVGGTPMDYTVAAQLDVVVNGVTVGRSNVKPFTFSW